eukprot:g23284.t1
MIFHVTKKFRPVPKAFFSPDVTIFCGSSGFHFGPAECHFVPKRVDTWDQCATQQGAKNRNLRSPALHIKNTRMTYAVIKETHVQRLNDGRRSMNDVLCVGICISSLLLTGVILFAVSFGTLEPTQVGLKYNKVTVEVYPEVYNNGRYFIGLGSEFIKFPMDLQLVEFIGPAALRAWSKEGQLVELDMSVEYRLRRSDIFNLYSRYGTDYHGRYQVMTVRAVKQISKEYEAVEFFTHREQIGREMAAALRARFGEEYADVELFNLRHIGLPNGFEQKIVDKVVKAQELQIAKNLKEIALIQANISVVRGNGDAVVTETLAAAEAQAVEITENAMSNNTRLLREAESAAYQDFVTALGLKGGDLLKFKWAQTQIDKLRELKPATTIEYLIGFKSPILSVKTNP